MSYLIVGLGGHLLYHVGRALIWLLTFGQVQFAPISTENYIPLPEDLDKGGAVWRDANYEAKQKIVYPEGTISSGISMIVGALALIPVVGLVVGLTF